MQKKYSLGSIPNSRKQRDEPSQLCLLQMPELFAVDLVNPVLHLVQQVQPVLRDSREDVTAILASPVPRDQLCLLQSIEKSRDIGYLPHQALANLASAQAFRFRPSKNAEHVVLGRRDAMRLQSALERVFEQSGGPLDAEVRFLLEALEWSDLLQLDLQL